ncbi:MAG: GNAT family N-acetyltransferase [Candidatus Thorarchaeota archaeon]|nr:GNAT family N-acetyltransferase [Candidatus Thorarchaeota archaeon]
MPEFTALVFREVTPATWADFETFFQNDPACNMCWCMYWRKPRSQLFGHATENKADMQRIVHTDTVPGFLAYKDGQVVGWCSVAPRSHYSGLDRSPPLKPIDDEPVWSITCFVVAKGYHRKGMTTALIKEAVRYAKEHGATIVEAYPLVNPDGKFRKPGESFMGFASTFEELGFTQVSERSEVRNIMRLNL